MGMKVLVCGGRENDDRNGVWFYLATLNRKSHISLVIDGMGGDTDNHAAAWAAAQGIPSMRFPAHWGHFKSKGNPRAAGPVRNGWMLEFGRPDLVLAFPGGTGTANMVAQARARLVQVIEIKSVVLTREE